jgi:hypothetical protein
MSTCSALRPITYMPAQPGHASVAARKRMLGTPNTGRG